MSACPAQATIVLGTPFRDGAVLQRGKPICIWGTAEPNEKLQLEFHGEVASAVADDRGHWQTSLPSLSAIAEPQRLSVSGGRDRVTIGNVVVGEVWLCSGQSNMYFAVGNGLNAQEEIRAANDPLLREFAPKAVAPKGEESDFDALIRDLLSDEPRANFEGEWKPAQSGTVGNFTAIGYFFARELRRHLAGNVPIGIIKATLGGSPIEAWLSPEALQENSAFSVVARRWSEMRVRMGAKMVGKSLRNQPSSLYNGLIHPLEPFALAGFLWDQGEANVDRPEEYPALFTTMIRQWRRDFHQGDLPFIFYQLHNFAGSPRVPIGPGGAEGERWPRLREAQTAALSLAQVGMVVTIDIGDATDIHYPNKQEAGRRGGLVARAQVYGETVEDSGPLLADAKREGEGWRIRFTHAQGLHFLGDPSRVFAVAGPDRKFVAAQARIEGESVFVSARDCPEPEAVCCEWSNFPSGWLVNGARLPAAPFRTDRWPEKDPKP